MGYSGEKEASDPMKQMVCSICSYTYDEAKGIPEAGIAPGTKWEDLPQGWKCPWCGAAKELFQEKKAPEMPAAAPEPAQPAAPAPVEEEWELSPMELSILCSNLARGCEKQYLPYQEAGFRQLAEWFRGQARPAAGASAEAISALVEQELSTGYPQAMQAAQAQPDRGAMRALVWSEKVTRMLQAILARYRTEGEKMLEHTGVYVCSVCGFVYVGDAPPERCPVCKVPAWKFDRIEGRG